MKKTAIILMILVATNYGCTQAKLMDSKSDKEVVINFFEETYNKKNYQYVMDFFATDYFEHRDDGARTNLDCANIIKGAEKIFPDMTVKIEDIVEENDLIAIRLTFNATHKDTFLGIEATSKNITWEAMEFFRLKDGKITESWGSWPVHDMVEMLTSK